MLLDWSMAKYRVMFREPVAALPDKGRKATVRVFLRLHTEQPSLAYALAWAYRQLAATTSPELIARVVSVEARLDDGTEGGAND